MVELAFVGWLWFIAATFVCSLLIAPVFLWRRRRRRYLSVLCAAAFLVLGWLWVRDNDRSREYVAILPIYDNAGWANVGIRLWSSHGHVELEAGAARQATNWKQPEGSTVRAFRSKSSPVIAIASEKYVVTFGNPEYDTSFVYSYGGFGVVFEIGPEISGASRPTWEKWDVFGKLSCPNWAAMALSSVLLLIWFARKQITEKKAALVRAGCCSNPKCRFDLRGTPVNADGTRRCSECGHINPAIGSEHLVVIGDSHKGAIAADAPAEATQSEGDVAG